MYELYILYVANRKTSENFGLSDIWSEKRIQLKFQSCCVVFSCVLWYIIFWHCFTPTHYICALYFIWNSEVHSTSENKQMIKTNWLWLCYYVETLYVFNKYVHMCFFFNLWYYIYVIFRVIRKFSFHGSSNKGVFLKRRGYVNN